jgi:hypothetical protein
MSTQRFPDHRDIAKNVSFSMTCVIIEYFLTGDFRYLFWCCWRRSLLQEGREDRGNEVYNSYVVSFYCLYLYLLLLVRTKYWETVFQIFWRDSLGGLASKKALTDETKMSNARPCSAMNQGWRLQMEAGGLVVVFVSIHFRTELCPVLFWSREEFKLTWLLDKCKEEGCMNLREYHNSKEKYFKYCLKRML